MRSVVSGPLSPRWLLLGLLVLDAVRAAAAPVATVGTSTNNAAASAAHERKAFFASGRHWVFYADGTNLVFQSSTDGTTWATKTGPGLPSP